MKGNPLQIKHGRKQYSEVKLFYAKRHAAQNWVKYVAHK